MHVGRTDEQRCAVGQCPHGTQPRRTVGAVPPRGATPPPRHMASGHRRAMPPMAEGHGPPARGHLPARRRRRVQRAEPWRLLTSQASGPAAPRPTRSSRRQCWSSSGIVTSHVPSCSPSTCPPLWAHAVSLWPPHKLCTSPSGACLAPGVRPGVGHRAASHLPPPGDGGLHVVDGDGDGGRLALHHVHHVWLVQDDRGLLQVGTCHAHCHHHLCAVRRPAPGSSPRRRAHRPPTSHPSTPPSPRCSSHPDPGAARAPRAGRACCWSWGWR